MTTLWDRDRNPRLLVVEGDIDIANMLKIYFAPIADVTIAARPEQALALYFQDLFDLIILDLEAPGLDAYEFMRSIRTSERKVPTLFLTTTVKRSDKLQGLEIEEDDYITKPFDIEELRLRIRGILNRLAGDTTTDAPPPEKRKKGK